MQILTVSDTVRETALPYRIHDGEDQCHRGFRSFLGLMDRHAPRYLIHGHRHIYRLLPFGHRDTIGRWLIAYNG